MDTTRTPLCTVHPPQLPDTAPLPATQLLPCLLTEPTHPTVDTEELPPNKLPQHQDTRPLPLLPLTPPILVIQHSPPILNQLPDTLLLLLLTLTTHRLVREGNWVLVSYTGAVWYTILVQCIVRTTLMLDTTRAMLGVICARAIRFLVHHSSWQCV